MKFYRNLIYLYELDGVLTIFEEEKKPIPSTNHDRAATNAATWNYIPSDNILCVCFFPSSNKLCLGIKSDTLTLQTIY